MFKKYNKALSGTYVDSLVNLASTISFVTDDKFGKDEILYLHYR